MWDARASAAIAAHLRDVHVARAARGVDATGAAFPPGVDLQKTGTLLNAFEADSDERSAVVRNTAPHAAPVNANTVPFMGLAPDERDGLDAVVEAQLDRIERQR